MTPWKKWLGVLLLFLLGFLCGLAAGPFFQRWTGPPSPDRILAHIEQDLTEKLELTPEQQQVFDTAARDAQGKLHELRRSVGPQLEQIFDEVQDRLIPVLSEEQRATLEEIRRERRERFRRLSPPPDGDQSP